MKARWLLAGLVLCAGVLGGAAMVQSRTTAPPMGQTCPSIANNYCLIQIHKQFTEGRRVGGIRASYTCSQMTTTRGTESLSLVLKSAGRPCDENPALIPDGSKLVVDTGGFFRRKDGLAHFCGTFFIQSGNTLLYQGTLETLDRVGSHSGGPGLQPCEKCNEKDHLEGWLVGRGMQRGADRFLRALIVAHVTNRSEDGTQASLEGIINGIVLNRPLLVRRR